MKDKIRETAEKYHAASGCPTRAGSNERPSTETVLTYDARRNKTLERDAHVGRWNWLEVGPCPAQSVERNWEWQERESWGRPLHRSPPTRPSERREDGYLHNCTTDVAKTKKRYKRSNFTGFLRFLRPPYTPVAPNLSICPMVGRALTHQTLQKNLKFAILAHSFKSTYTFVTDVSKTLFQHYCSIQIHLIFWQQ